ncbi:unnamed protein product [Peniophora sp. CBMAI 1063]|nr:unnamed protein product [Peniophora sp. CBMAI 1063]
MKPHPFTFVAAAIGLSTRALAVPAQEPLVVSHHSAPPAEVDLSAGWVDPRILGGRMLDWPGGELGEPLNIIVSGLSDPFVLTPDGFRAYTKSIGYSEECLGLHYGTIHTADLGDGLRARDEQYLARQQYFPMWGTCWESFAGGHHFRAWRQNGSLADSGAWFVGASQEEHSRKNHMIVEDGWNKGRDWFVERAVAGTHWKGIWWVADVEWREGLLAPGHKGINHGIAQDGRVAVLTVRRV